MKQKILVASDHAGFEMKRWILAQVHLQPALRNYEWVDLGPSNDDRVDYPDFADKVSRQVILDQNKSLGLLICGSGQGMAMRANKYSEIRAALVWDQTTAALAKEHNDANVLCVGGRLLPQGLILEILETFLNAQFQGGRHATRVEKLGRPPLK